MKHHFSNLQALAHIIMIERMGLKEIGAYRQGKVLYEGLRSYMIMKLYHWKRNLPLEYCCDNGGRTRNNPTNSNRSNTIWGFRLSLDRDLLSNSVLSLDITVVLCMRVNSEIRNCCPLKRINLHFGGAVASLSVAKWIKSSKELSPVMKLERFQSLRSRTPRRTSQAHWIRHLGQMIEEIWNQNIWSRELSISLEVSLGSPHRKRKLASLASV